MRYRLAFLTTHPIQYQAPLLRKLAAHPELDLTVYFCSRTGVEERWDPGFSRVIRWDVPLLEGYAHKFLANLWYDRLTWRGLINPGIIREIWVNRYDALLIHGWAYPTALLALAAGRLRGTPVFFRAETNPRSYSYRGVKRQLQFLTLKKIFRAVAGFMVIGTLNHTFYRGAGVPAPRLFWMPYAVDNDFFLARAPGDRARLRSKHGLLPESPVIMFCGKLIPAKDPLTLLKAFGAVRQSAPCQLLMVGDGICRERLEHYVQEHQVPDVHWVGFQNQTELPEYYGLADILVLPSAFEPWGLAVNEAMCFSQAVVVSDQVGCGPDLVKEGENGFSFPAGDQAALAACLKRLVQDPSLRGRMGQRSLALIREWDYEADLQGLLGALRATVPPRKDQPHG
jgi:glycosyltransferase involved in cell wall biosynthesis